MERNRLMFCIGRFDHYFDSVNAKSAVFLALATFIVGGMIAGYPAISSKVDIIKLIQILYVVIMGIGFLALITVIIAAIPFVSKQPNSIIYFGSIANMQKSEFENKSVQFNEEEEIIDLREQVHNMAKGLRRKFILLGYVGYMFTSQFILFVPLLILILLNLK